MQKSTSSRSPGGGDQKHARSASGSQGNSLLSSLKKLATGSGNQQSSQPRKELISSPRRVVTTASLESVNPIGSAKPLNKSSALNTHNISHYTVDPETHSRSHSASLLTSPTKYSYSRRSSQLTRTSTNRSMTSLSAGSINSGSASTLNRFLTNDGTLKLDKPDSMEEIDNLFMDLLIKRNVFDSVSSQDQKDMLDYPPEKKWLMIKQDLQAEFKRLKSSKSRFSGSEVQKPLKRNTSASKLNTQYESMLKSNESQTSLLSPSHIPPEYYVRHIISKKIKNKELNDLWVSLRTEPIDWVISFLDAQGQIAIANFIISSMHHDSTDGIATINDTEFLERETALFKCLRVLLNIRECLEDAMKSTLVTNALVEGLLSTRISTRRLATETLIYLVAKDEDLKSRTAGLDPFPLVMESLNHEAPIMQNVHIKAKLMQSISDEPSNHPELYQVCKMLQQWLSVVEQTLDGRGKMGSLVGASEEYKNSTGENSIFEYLVESMVLITQLCIRSDDVKKRHMMRSRLKSIGLNRIIQKMQMLDYSPLSAVLLQFEDGAIDDYNLILESQRSSQNVDMNDPVSILHKLTATFKNTEAEAHLLSMLQNLFLSSNKNIQEHDDVSKNIQQLKLIDSLVSNVAITSIDSESNFNVAIQRLYDAMQTDEIARRAILESRELSKKLEEVKAERDYLNDKISKSENGLVGQLQEELTERDRILSKTQRVTEQLQSELEELKKKHLLEKHAHEIELRKMLTIVNSKTNVEIADDSVPRSERVPKTLSSDKKTAIQKVLQKSLQKTEQDLLNESRRLDTSVGSKSRLKLLRSKMEDIENEARELEMTNFSDIKPKRNHKDKEKIKAQQASKLMELRQKLASIQNESNDITKFNIEARVNELFQDKKLTALDRLKDLEQKYKGFDINFEQNPELNALLNESKATNSSLDPKIGQQKVEELDSILDDINLLSKELAEKDEEDDLGSGSSSSSSMTSSKEESDEAESIQDSDVASSGSSFFESLSKKFSTGQQGSISAIATSGGRDTRYPGSGYHRRSFMNRLKHTTVPSSGATEGLPAFLTELKSKVRMEEEGDEVDEPVGIGLSVANGAQLINKEAVQKNHSTGETVNTQSSQQQNEKIPIDEVESTLLKATNAEAGESPSSSKPDDPNSPPPPPPPAPPLPNNLSRAFTGTASAPPPPPLPSSLSAANSVAPSPISLGSGATSPSPAPPAPPPPPFPSIQTPKTPVASPLLPQSPSLFERYPRPKKKLKQLHWEKIDNTGDSIWKNAQAEKVADDLFEKGVLSQLEKAFAARDIKSLKSKSKEIDEKITFLSRDVSQQFGINLHMYSNLSVKQIVEKVLKCDRDFLSTPSVIEFLSKPSIIEVTNNLARNFNPYSTDWEGVKSVEDAKPPEKDPNELQRADQLYVEFMINLQSYWGSRMRAITMITSYEKDYTDLVLKLRCVDKAVQSIQQSENLRRVFDVILAVGNYMNDSSKQAHGFKLSTLQRLTFIKDDKNSMTFLNYVEKILRDNYPEYSEFVNELEPIFNATKIAVDQLVADCKDFTQSIMNVERSIDIGNLSDPSKFHPIDRVLNKVVPVLPEARKKADLLSDEVKLSLLEFENLMRKFNEDPADRFSKNSFFQKFADFITEFKKARTFNLKLEEEEKAYERRKKLIEQQNKLKDGNANSITAEGGTSLGAQDDRDAMDKLLNKLKNAGPAKGDPSSARKRALARKKLMTGSGGSSILDNITADTSIEGVSEENKIFTASPTASKTAEPANIPSERASISKEDPVDRARNLLKELRGSDELRASVSSAANGKDRVRVLRRKSSNHKLDSSPTKLQFVGSSDNIASETQATPNTSDEEFIDA